MKQSNVLTGYVFGSIITLLGTLTAIFVDKSAVSQVFQSGR
jgi:hypothetical protein